MRTCGKSVRMWRVSCAECVVYRCRLRDSCVCVVCDVRDTEERCGRRHQVLWGEDSPSAVRGLKTEGVSDRTGKVILVTEVVAYGALCCIASG